MSFLTIPSQGGLFTTVKAGKSAEDGYSSPTCPVDDDDDDDEDDEDDGREEVKFIPRCSPIPRKRGQSIYDEAAEYMRIHLSLPAARRRVSFADTTGGNLVDVREFVAFGSDEEEDSSFEADDSHSKEPIYGINTEFHVLTRSALAEAVKTNKVEVELLSPIESEPLAFSGLVRVLNISYHKAVYIRSTMDHWATYFDHPAQYVEGSNDGETDAFCFKLSFAPPYDTHGSRIEFVVRYETSDGDFWANNSLMNYVVTLLVSYGDKLTQVNSDKRQEIRGILKARTFHSVDNDGEQRMDEEDLPVFSHPVPVRPLPVCPIIIHSEIDLETADDPLGSPLPPNQEPQSLDDAQCDHASMHNQSPCISRHDTADQPLHVLSQVRAALQSSESRALPSVPCELVNQISGRLEEAISGSALQPVPTPFQPRSTSPSAGSLAEGVEQEKDSFALDKLKAFAVTHPPIMEAGIHFSSENDEVEVLHTTLGDKKVKGQTFLRGEKDVVIEKVKHLDSEFSERPSECRPREPTHCKTEETLQTAPLVSLHNPGISDVPSTPNTLLPTASVMPREHPPSRILHFDLLETSMTTKTENNASKAQSCMLTQLEWPSIDRETEQERREAQAVLISHSDDHSGKEPSTKAGQVYEEQAASGDTAVSLEEDENVRQAMASADIGKTNGEEGLTNQNTNTDRPFIFQFGASVKNNLLYPSDSESTTTQASLVDPDMISRDAVDTLKETSTRPEDESTDLASADTWFTPTAPESPLSAASSPSVGPSGPVTAPSVESTGASTPCLPKAGRRGFPGEEQKAATSNAAAANISAAADVRTLDATRGKTEAAEPPQRSSDASAEHQPHTSPSAAEPLRWRPECGAGGNFRLSVVFLCGAVCFTVVLTDPSSLFFVGLALTALFFLITSD